MVAAKIQFKTVDEYVTSFPKNVEEKLQSIRQVIKEVVPQSEEKISYQLPAFVLNGKSLIYFSAWKKHISLYPYTVRMEEELQQSSIYNTSGKGTIQFPLDQPLPLPLIRKIVEMRLIEISE